MIKYTPHMATVVTLAGAIAFACIHADVLAFMYGIVGLLMLVALIKAEMR